MDHWDVLHQAIVHILYLEPCEQKMINHVRDRTASSNLTPESTCILSVKSLHFFFWNILQREMQEHQHGRLWNVYKASHKAINRTANLRQKERKVMRMEGSGLECTGCSVFLLSSPVLNVRKLAVLLLNKTVAQPPLLPSSVTECRADVRSAAVPWCAECAEKCWHWVYHLLISIIQGKSVARQTSS